MLHVKITQIVSVQLLIANVEVRDSRTGYLIPVRDGPGASPDLESCWDAAAVAAVIIFPGTCSQNGFFRKCP